MTGRAVDDRPWYRLTRHFFAGLFDFGVLSEAGSDSFARLLIGIIAVMLTFGLLIARMYMGKYAALAALHNPAAIRLAIVGDDALAIGLPMLIVAFATLLVSQSLFPDETDFRVLLALPISQRVVFLSKLLALVLFTGIFIVASHLAMALLVMQISLSRAAEHTLAVRLAAHWAASVGASVFAVLGVTALNGVLLTCVPRARLQAASTACRSILLFALVLALPLIARLPMSGRLVGRESRLLYLAPPLWFVGAERMMLGTATPYFTRLGEIAAIALVSALIIAVASYTYLYQRFDRVMLRPAGAGGTAQRGRHWSSGGARRRPIFTAISLFTRATLARSPLHQGAFVAVAACGAGLVMNSFISAMNMTGVRNPEREIVNTVIGAPFTLIFVMVIAVRAALVLPIEPRANWVFRMTENAAARTEQLSAVVHTVVRFGVLWPVVVLLPVQWAVLGWQALICAAIAFLSGLVLVELQWGDWQRIPFTCSFIPGKRFFGLTMLVGLTAFVFFTTIGWALTLLALARPVARFVIFAILGAVVFQRRRQRRHVWQHTALVFEDVLPTEVEPLRLSAY